MSTLFGRRLAPLVVGALALIAAGGTRAADDKETVDKKVSAILVTVIDKGVDLYNSGDQNGCFRLYEGSLQSMRPFLDSKPEWQKAIDAALADAAKQPSVAERAFTLRRAMDKIYFEINPKKVETPPPPPKTLWDRLGGEKGVTKVIDDFVATASKDPKVNFDRDGKYKLDATSVAKLEKESVELVSSLTGGPLKYTGKSMKEVHKGMGITDAEFDATAGHLKKALESNGVKKEDVDTVMKAVGEMKKEIVEPKKPDPKPEPSKDGQLKGAVIFEGKPVGKAKVYLVPGDKGDPVTADTKEDGTFAVTGLKPGAYKVRITVAADSAIKLQAKYTDTDTSGLKVEIKEITPAVEFNLKADSKPAPKPDPKPEDSAKTGDVSGKVTVDGKPLTGATVLFVPEKGNPTSGLLKADGSYTVEKLKPGKYKLAVVALPDAKPEVKVPEKFADPDKSGLTVDVKEGKNVFDMMLLK